MQIPTNIVAQNISDETMIPLRFILDNFTFHSWVLEENLEKAKHAIIDEYSRSLVGKVKNV